jgi:hypothetical protein
MGGKKTITDFLKILGPQEKDWKIDIFWPKNL